MLAPDCREDAGPYEIANDRTNGRAETGLMTALNCRVTTERVDGTPTNLDRSVDCDTPM
jgi:hypothetical protein